MYQAVYKCRLCGETVKGCQTGNENIALAETINAILGTRGTQPLAPRIMENHDCKDGSIGVADFQGFKKWGVEEQVYHDLCELQKAGD